MATLTHEPRFREPSLADDADPQWAIDRAAVTAALGPFWDAVCAIANFTDKLDRFAGAHGRAADAGEARPDAAYDIRTLTPRLEAVMRLLEAIEIDSRVRAA